MDVKPATIVDSQENPDSIIQTGTRKAAPDWTNILIVLLIVMFFCFNLSYLIEFIFLKLSFFKWIIKTYAFSTIYFPALVLISGLTVFAEYRMTRIEKKQIYVSILLITIAVFLFSIRIYATHIEPNFLVLRRVSLSTPKLEKPVRLLHITDIQSAAVGSHEERAFRKINELKPDLILNTGDMLQPIPPATWNSELPKITQLFDTISAPLGMFNIEGDSDWSMTEVIRKNIPCLTTLYSQSAIVPVGKSRIRILGLSCKESRYTGENRIKRWLDESDPNDFTILMGHAPDYILAVNDLKIDLCLAGHTHGGQVRIPGFGPISYDSNIPSEWARGFRSVGSTHLNVSAGIGCEHCENVPPIRVFCPPEMTLIELKPISLIEKF